MTSTDVALRHDIGAESVLRLMTREPWRTHGAGLTTRERAAQLFLAGTDVPAPTSLALDADGTACGVPAHLMSRLPGVPVGQGVELVRDGRPARQHPPAPPERALPDLPVLGVGGEVGRARVDPTSRVLATRVRGAGGTQPAYEPTFLHRDFGHRNLLWTDGAISGVVDWVETSTGPAWLDAAHGASNLAVMLGTEPAHAFLDHYAELTTERLDPHWLVMDAVGYLPPPGREPMFGRPDQLERLDDWLDRVVRLS